MEIDLGFGSAAVLVASFGCAQKSAVISGLPESMEVQAVVSGLFTASFALGNFCGPTLSGIIYDQAGFSYNCLVLQLLVLVVLALNTVCYCCSGPSRPDYEAIPDTPTATIDTDRRNSVFPELPADVIRSRPDNVPRRPAKHRKYSTSSSVYERSAIVY